MRNLYVWAVVLLAVLIGGYWLLQKDGAAPFGVQTSDGMGSYEYQCENGSQFTMSPASDMRTITLSNEAQFIGGFVLRNEEYGTARYGGALNGMSDDTPVTFVGAGEEVRLTIGSEATVCNPVPSQDMAPWNWGDAGEGGGVKQDVSLIVGENILGKWVSVDDAKCVREFKTGFTATDWYENKPVSEGLWIVFTKMTAPEISFPLEENTVYLQMTMQGTQDDTLNFKVTKVTPEELELIYMDRGGVLRFTRVR